MLKWVGYFFLSLFFCNVVHAQDILAHPRIAQVVPSPDGKQVAFVTYQVTTDNQLRKWEYSLYLKDTSGKINLLTTADKISAMSWLHDGSALAYLAHGKQFQSIWTITLATHKTKKLFEFNNDISSFKFSPDDRAIAFTADVIVNKPTHLPIDVAHDYANTRLYLVNLKNITHAEPLTAENISVSQFFVYPGFDWSPDGKSIVVGYQPRAGAAFALQNKIGILNIVDHALKNIPYTETHASVQPAYSPDGNWIAFQSSPARDEVSNPEKALTTMSYTNMICVAQTSTFATHCLAKTFNQSATLLGWDAASKNVFVLDAYKTLGYEIYRLNLDAKTAEDLSHAKGFIEPLTVALNTTHSEFGFGYETAQAAPEAFVSAVNPFQLEAVSQFATPSSTKLGNTQVIHWHSVDGKDMEGLLITPTNYDSKKSYPMLVSIHGGPAGAWATRYLGGCDEYGEMFDPTTCWSHYLNLGFVIFAPNPRGSTGYGSDFRLANFADFAGKDFQDVMTGVSQLIRQRVANPNHLAVAGWSYGGYMTAWIISHTHEFKAAVDGDGLSNLISFSGTSDIPVYTEGYLGAPFWEYDNLYFQRSPIFAVKNVTTPLLILQGQKDMRVPSSQAYELFTALDRQHKNVKMLLLPEQGHVPTDPNMIAATIDAVDDWLKMALA